RSADWAFGATVKTLSCAAITVTSVPAATSVAPKLALNEMGLLNFAGLGNALAGIRVQFTVTVSTSGMVGGTKPSSLVGAGMGAGGGVGATRRGGAAGE